MTTSRLLDRIEARARRRDLLAELDAYKRDASHSEDIDFEIPVEPDFSDWLVHVMDYRANSPNVAAPADRSDLSTREASGEGNESAAGAA